MVNTTSKGMLILLMLTISHIQANYHLSNEHFRKGSNPGMHLQIYQGDTTIVQKYFTHFLPKWADTALGVRPNSTDFSIVDPFWHMIGVDAFDANIQWDNIKYEDHEVRLDEIKFELLDVQEHGIFLLDFPAYKNLVVTAQQTIDHWFFGDESEIKIMIKDFDMDFKGVFRANDNGSLTPVVYGCDINFGESDITSTSILTEIILWEVVHFSFIVIHNAAWITGPIMFTQILGPVMDKYLNHYVTEFPIQSPIVGQDITQTFLVDYRNTMNPDHTTASVLFSLVGEFFYENQGCKEWNPREIPRNRQRDSQLALSTTAVECMAEQFSKTDLGKFELNEESLDKMFRKGYNQLTTTTLAGTMPVLQEKLGKDKKLNFILSYKDFKVNFDEYNNPGDQNYKIFFTLLMSINADLEGKQNGLKIDIPDEQEKDEEVLYDEIQFVIEGTAFNTHRTQFRPEQHTEPGEVWSTFGVLNKFQLDHTHGNRHQPYRNSIGLTKNEYLEYLSGLGAQMKKNKDFLNLWLHYGIKYPLAVPEFYCLMRFMKDAIYFIYVKREFTEQEQEEFHTMLENL